MNPRIIGVYAFVMLVIGIAIGYSLFGGSAKAAPLGPTDLVVGQNYEVNDTFVCDAGDPTMQVREWHFTGADRSRRNQSTIDWYRNINGHRVSRIKRVDSFPNDGKKYMRIVMITERGRQREAFDYGGSDTGRWAHAVEHNLNFEPQLATPKCGPAR